MGLSKSTRIQILLAIDTVFFFIELVTGYAVHSLALVADSFHMLNDVISLCVGLWAVKVAGRTTSSKTYTYGWQRAETLGALINGVFLVALCLSIFLEAIQRFVEPQEVTQPKLILIVGCFGLASNITGLFLFHDHSHSHGSHGHSHDHADGLGAAEEGRHNHYDEDEIVRDEHGNIADVLPQQRVRTWSPSRPQTIARDAGYGTTTNGTENSSDTAFQPSSPHTPRRHAHRHSASRSRGYSGLEDIHVHPASLRKDIIRAAQAEEQDSGASTDDDGQESAIAEEEEPHEHSPLLQSSAKGSNGHSHTHKSDFVGAEDPQVHKKHQHSQDKKNAKKGGHSHDDLNMRGVFLHVMGDALGNIGVIATALFIWLTPFSWRFYTDPAISLVITVIILLSAIPLCKAASRILLQAVPPGISVDDIKDDITQLPGIVSCHHLHVWQLSDTKLVASLHVQVGFDFKTEGSARYMSLARDIRSCLHAYGIHSSTIQPEFCQGAGPASVQAPEDSGSEPRQASKDGSRRSSVRRAESCLLECDNECGTSNQCCAPNRGEEEAGHQH